MFENKVLRRILVQKREEVAGDQRKLHSGELHNLCASLHIVRVIKSRRMRWAGHVARIGAMRNEYKILVGKPEGKRPLGRPRCPWKDNIRIDIREIEWEGVYWMHRAQDRVQWRALVHTVTNLRVPKKARNFLTSSATTSFSRRTLLHGV
jgi:hypothetical protein